MYATFNITNNRFKVYPEGAPRLTPEQDTTRREYDFSSEPVVFDNWNDQLVMSWYIKMNYVTEKTGYNAFLVIRDNDLVCTIQPRPGDIRLFCKRGAEGYYDGPPVASLF
jgi:hypothetical protein